MPNDHDTLVTRATAKLMLGCSTDTLRRLERRGLLTPIRFDPTNPKAFVHYKLQQVLDLMNSATPRATPKPEPMERAPLDPFRDASAELLESEREAMACQQAMLDAYAAEVVARELHRRGLSAPSTRLPE